MNKKSLVFVLVPLVLSVAFYLMQRQRGGASSGPSVEIFMDDRYFITSDLSITDFSNDIFDPILFGSLLTLDAAGEPKANYLTLKYTSSEQGRVWTFQLQPGVGSETVANLYNEYISMQQILQRPHPFIAFEGIGINGPHEISFKFLRPADPGVFTFPPKVKAQLKSHKQSVFKWLPGFHVYENRTDGMEMKRNQALRFANDGKVDRLIIRRVPPDELAQIPKKNALALFSSDGPRPDWAKEPLVRLEATQTIAVVNAKLKNGQAELSVLRGIASRTPLKSIFSSRASGLFVEPSVPPLVRPDSKPGGEKLSIVAYGIWSGAEKMYLMDIVRTAYGDRAHLLFRNADLNYPGYKRSEEDISILQLSRIQRFSIDRAFELFCMEEEPYLPDARVCEILFRGDNLPKIAADFQVAVQSLGTILPLFTTRPAIYATDDLIAEGDYGLGRLRFLKKK